MTDKELQRLKRAELLEILLEQGKEIEKLRAQVEALQKKMEDREIHIDKAGSIAEASLQLNGVFEAAQDAAKQYLENIESLNQRQEQVCAAMEKKTKEKCAAMEEETNRYCLAKKQEVEKEVEERWGEIVARLENFYNAHQGLRELVDLSGKI